MPWVKQDDDRFLNCEEFLRDDDRTKVIGTIMRFYADGPTYAAVEAGRIGPISGPAYGDGTVYGDEFYLGSESDVAARSRVEALAEIPRPRSTGGRDLRCFGYYEI